MLRPANELERTLCLGGSEGFVYEKDGVVVGHIAYLLLEGYDPSKPEFYIHSLAVYADDSLIAARLSQAVAKRAKALGYENCLYHVKADNPSMLRLLDSQRASVDSYFIRINT